ncbi:MAG: hypothetical protein LBF22_02900 [Deltaproteobacteria bacterium]|jgi:hypothetical protein|nr:hypothetical protein [Deltaproteobacteria bacterium]
MAKKNFFIILSSLYIPRDDILPYYYSRVKIEQVFDITKGCEDLIPLRVHNEEILRGHLILSFMATTIYLLTNTLRKPLNIASSKAFHIFCRVFGKIFKSKIITTVPDKDINVLLKGLKFELPSEIKRE